MQDSISNKHLKGKLIVGNANAIYEAKVRDFINDNYFGNSLFDEHNGRLTVPND